MPTFQVCYFFYYSIVCGSYLSNMWLPVLDIVDNLMLPLNKYERGCFKKGKQYLKCKELQE